MRTVCRLSLSLLVAATAGLVTPAALADALRLRYEATMGTLTAGFIDVAITADAQRYEVTGEAQSTGLLDLVKEFRSRFSAWGRLHQGEPQAEHYHYAQRDVNKEKQVTVEKGQVTYVRNGEKRPTTAVQPGIDLVAALWVVEDCARLRDVHTGRNLYQFNLLEQSAEGCRFNVKSEDRESDVEIFYAERGGRRVPSLIRSSGVFDGELHLTE